MTASSYLNLHVHTLTVHYNAYAVMENFFDVSVYIEIRLEQTLSCFQAFACYVTGCKYVHSPSSANASTCNNVNRRAEKSVQANFFLTAQNPSLRIPVAYEKRTPYKSATLSNNFIIKLTKNEFVKIYKI